MKIIKIGIAPQEKIRERALAIVRGDIKPIPSDPKIWFTSVDSLSRVVRDENRVLWDVVCSTLPPST
jgi:predicted transcriptional regulator